MPKVGALKKRDADRGRRSAKKARAYKTINVGQTKATTYSSDAPVCRCDRKLPHREGRTTSCCKCGKTIP